MKLLAVLTPSYIYQVLSGCSVDLLNVIGTALVNFPLPPPPWFVVEVVFTVWRVSVGDWIWGYRDSGGASAITGTIVMCLGDFGQTWSGTLMGWANVTPSRISLESYMVILEKI